MHPPHPYGTSNDLAVSFLWSEIISFLNIHQERVADTCPLSSRTSRYIYPKMCDQGLLRRQDPPEWQGWGENGLCYHLSPTLLTKSHLPNLLKCSCRTRASSSPGGEARTEGSSTCPIVPVPPQPRAAVTAVWSQASESALWWKAGSYGMGYHI